MSRVMNDQYEPLNAPVETKPVETNLGKTFAKLQRKKAFAEFMDVGADVANGFLLIEAESEFAEWAVFTNRLNPHPKLKIEGRCTCWFSM